MESNKHQLCWIRNECIIPHFMAQAIQIKRCAKRHTHTILYYISCLYALCGLYHFLFVLRWCPFFAINLYQSNHGDAIFFVAFVGPYQLLSSQHQKKFRFCHEYILLSDVLDFCVNRPGCKCIKCLGCYDIFQHEKDSQKI